jgi:hypothetical protein
LKTPVAIFLLLLYAVALLRPLVPLIGYYVKIEEYKSQCINKSEPVMKCNGQCQLQKQIRAMDDPTSQEPVAPLPVKLSAEDFPLALIADANILGLGDDVIVFSIKGLRNSVSHHGGFNAEIFHPPLRLF